MQRPNRKLMKISSLSLVPNITLRVGNRVGKSYLVIKKGFRKLRNPLVLLAGTTRLELATFPHGHAGRSNQNEL